jgi:hypothetical protein
MLHAPIARARAGALLGLVVGLGIAASAAIYIALVSTVLMTDGGFPVIGFVYIAAVGVLPLVVGLPIALVNGLRLRLLQRAATHPEQVDAAELAMRWGKPALRICFTDRKSVAIATGDLDRNMLIEEIRAGRMPRKLPGARVHSPSRR